MDRQWYEELLSKVDLAALISRYVHLTKKGSTYWGCCPFHHETQPSFTVSPGKNFYYCYGCKESGNAITFLSKIESVDRGDAIRILCEETKTPLPDYGGWDEKKEAALIARKKYLSGLLREAALHYHENLKEPNAASAVKYLAARQIDERLVVKFGLGYSQSGGEMLEYLLDKGYTNADMKDAGLAAQSGEQWYDVFYGRLIIPIVNAWGDVTGFGGRLLAAKPDFAKYRNSSQSLVFDKSRTVYGVNLLKKKKMSDDIPYVIMTEGYMDTIMLHKAGFDTAVASMGTSLTFEQAKLLKNYSDKIYISYDGDSAGQKAALRGLDILDSVGLSVRVVELPEGMDPDDVIKERGAGYYRELLDKALTLPAFKLKKLLKNYDVAQPDGKSKYAVEAIKIIKKLPSLVEQEEYLQQVGRYTGYAMEILRKQADITEGPAESSPPPKTPKKQDGSLEMNFILASMLNRRVYVDYNDDIAPLLNDDFERNVYSFIIDSFKKDDFNLGFLYETVPGEEDRLEALIQYQFIDGDNAVKYRKCMANLRIIQMKQEIDALNELYKKNKDYESLQRINRLSTKIELMKKGGGQDV